MLKKSRKPETSAANNFLFEEDYWNLLYGDSYTIDGIYNAKEHIAYIKSIFKLMNIYVSTLGDFGFGKGNLLKEASRVFKPRKVIALDPSQKMVDELLHKKWIQNYNIAIFHGTIENFFTGQLEKEPLDFCICNSVFQYVRDDIPGLMEKISKCVRYLYFSVPTKKDYSRMKKSLGFSDPYAYARTRRFYLNSIKPYFSVVSFNLLESKTNKKSEYAFTDELFRF